MTMAQSPPVSVPPSFGVAVGAQNVGQTPGGQEVAEDFLGSAIGILQSVVHASKPTFSPLSGAGFVAVIAHHLCEMDIFNDLGVDDQFAVNNPGLGAVGIGRELNISPPVPTV